MAELLTIDRRMAQAISEGTGRAELEALAARAGFRSMIGALEGQVMGGKLREEAVGSVHS